MKRIPSIALGILLLAASGGCVSPETDSNNSTSSGSELTTYQGEKLDNSNNFFENSIKGPQKVEIAKYRLRIVGLVDKPQELTYDQVITGFPSQDKVIKIDCVEGWSVKVLWTGVPVAELLAAAQVSPQARVVIFRSIDGYSTSLPLSYILDKKVLLAYKINGLTLPVARGYPFELAAEGKWGYKWIKWVNQIELSDDVNFRGYWESRGYNQDGDLSGPIYQP